MASVDELWLVDFGDPFPGEPAHHRPALIVGPDEVFGTGLPFVIVCPMTTAHRALSLHVEVVPDPTNGLDAVSYVQTELLRSIARRRLVHRLGAIDPTSSAEVHHRLRVLLGH
jgi:mRNA interferase MazF